MVTEKQRGLVDRFYEDYKRICTSLFGDIPEEKKGKTSSEVAEVREVALDVLSESYPSVVEWYNTWIKKKSASNGDYMPDRETDEEELGLFVQSRIATAWRSIWADYNGTSKGRPRSKVDSIESKPAKNESATNDDLASMSDNNDSHGFTSMYRAIVERYSLIPPDDVMSLLSGVSVFGVASARRKMRLIGFVIDSVSNKEVTRMCNGSADSVSGHGWWVVKDRPQKDASVYVANALRMLGISEDKARAAIGLLELLKQ